MSNGKANITKEQITKAIESGKENVVFNFRTGDIVSFHKTIDAAWAKAAKLGCHVYQAQSIRIGYEF